MKNELSKKIRLMAVDLDGTLFNSEHRVSEITETVLKQTLQSGIQIILATGRSRTYVNDLLHSLGVDLPYICSGGSILISGRDGETHYVRTLQLNGYMKSFIPWAETNQIALIAEYPDGRIRWHATEDFLEQLSPGLRAELSYDDRTLNPYLDYKEPVLKFSLMQMGSTVYSAADLEKMFPDLQFVYSGYNCMDLTAIGVDKGSALAFFADQHGYKPEEIAAIGDQTNDLGMLRYAGLAFAMGNAAEVVKAEADWIAPLNDENGAAWAMQQIIQQNQQA
jgi:Cof subfamily protein (haloacid dehalogenase superfamily)